MSSENDAVSSGAEVVDVNQIKRHQEAEAAHGKHADTGANQSDDEHAKAKRTPVISVVGLVSEKASLLFF